MADDRFRRHDVSRRDRPDGSVILTSNLPLGPVTARTTDWLDHWAAATPDAVFLAERAGAGWREVSYGAARDRARAIAASLLRRGLDAGTPILIVSGNSVDHGLLALGAQYVGVPVVPLAEQYALMPEARDRLDQAAGLIRPAMVFAGDGGPFGAALSRPSLAEAEKVAGDNVPDGMTPFASLLDGQGDVTAAHAAVGPDTVAKILMTSGSTSVPKGVLTTHRMMCTNQAQLAATLPFLARSPPRIVDWLPWNHVFGGSHNFNMMLANGGALYIDDGKPTPALIARTIENQRLITGTLAFNVPVGFALLRDALRDDADLRRRYFADLDMLFYAGASLPQDVWDDLAVMAREVRGDAPLFTSSWGLTESAPSAVIQHEPTSRPGIVGVPVPGVEVKLIPEDENRFEARLKGPTITPGYFRAPDTTAAAFDAEGHFITGDAMAFVAPGHAGKGLRFDGRIAEDFKLLSGTWVRAGALRLELLDALAELASDVILIGANRADIGLLIVPSDRLRRGGRAEAGALIVDDTCLRAALGAANAGRAPSARVARAMVVSEPPSIADGEITAKGNLNFRRILARRAGLVERLYDDTDPAVILVSE